MDLQKLEDRKEKAIENILVTSTDLIILNALLYLYNTKREPITIPEIARSTAINYTTIRYSLNKFKNFGAIEEVPLDEKRAKMMGYVPKTKCVIVIDKSYVIIVLEDLIIPYLVSNTDMSNYVGKIISLEEAPMEIKQIIESIGENIETLLEYGYLLKEDYLDILYKQYLDLRKKLYS